MYLNKRCLFIIKKFLEKEKLEIEELSKIFKVSERTIRYDLENINKVFANKKILLLEKNKKGIFELVFKNKEEIEKILELYSVLSNEERIIYLTIKILKENFLNITSESKKLKISRSTLKNDYNILKEDLKKFQIKIIYLSNKGVSIVGEEEKIRQLFVRTFMKIFTNKGIVKSFLGDLILEIYREIKIENLKTFINKIQVNFNKKVSDNGYNVILSYLIVMKLRDSFFESEEKIYNKEFIKKTLEYKNIKANQKYLGKDFSEESLVKITDLFLGIHSYNEETSFYENWINIEILIKKVVEEFNKETSIDLSNDKYLLKGLLVHIKPAIYRMKNNIMLENDIFSEIIKENQKLFNQVKNSLKILENFLGMEFSNQEIAFLVVPFKVAIERRENLNLKKVLFVCKYGYITSRILAEKILEEYNIDIIDIIPSYLLEEYNFEKIDLVISTVEIKNNIAVPHIVISSLLLKEDLLKIEDQGIVKKKNKISITKLTGVLDKYLKENSKEKLSEELILKFKGIIKDDRKIKKLELLDLLRKDTINLNGKFKNWQESILKCGEILEKKGDIKKSYINNVIKAIESYGSYMVISDKVIIPHAKNDEGVINTGMCLMSLEEEVLFPNNEEIDLIIFFSSKDKTEHLNALRTLVEILSEHNFKNEIKKMKRPEEVVEYIKSKEEII